ncbi:MAG: hypothetical protein ACTHOP_08980 [Mesorhizobium sp.]
MKRLHATAVSLLAAAALSACNTSDVLQPAAPPQPAASAIAGPATVAQPAQAPLQLSAEAKAAIARMRLQIAPMVGTTVEAAGPLTERLNLRARERGIQLAGSTDSNATHVLKGYFSLLSEGKDTTVIYVWDIYDPAGNRLHRINGQQKVEQPGSGEGWAAVPPQTMQAIADATMNQLVAWLAGTPG